MRQEIPENRPVPSSSTLVEAARDFLARGWPVIPLSGKLPMIPWKEYQTRLPTNDEARAWFSAIDNPTTGLGIVTGNLSRLVVVDCDSQEDALFWQAEHGSSPVAVSTGGGGVHLYYAMPDESEVRNRARLGGRKIDVRGEGGYATAPPSLHPLGTRYEWLSFPAFATLPVFDAEWLLSKVDERHFVASAVATEVRNAIAYIRRIQAVASEGGHNATFRVACKLRDAGLSPDDALMVLSEWNETNASPPWSARELAHKIDSAYKTLTK
jgi:hypothetical protein